MTSLDNFIRVVDNSLILLEVPFIRWLIIIIVILYDINAIPQINNTMSQWFRWVWVRLFFMLLILYIGFKDKTLALLLGIAYTLSVHTLNISRLESTNIEKPYIDPPSDIEEPSSDVEKPQDNNSNTQSLEKKSAETSSEIIDDSKAIDDANAPHPSDSRNDYLNIQFSDPLRSYKNINQCSAPNDVAVTDKDKEILNNPCTLNKD